MYMYYFYPLSLLAYAQGDRCTKMKMAIYITSQGVLMSKCSSIYKIWQKNESVRGFNRVYILEIAPILTPLVYLALLSFPVIGIGCHVTCQG